MRILVLQHVPHEPPGGLADGLAAVGATLEVATLWERPQVPSLDGFDALIVLGGPMGVNDPPSTFPTKDTELALIKEAGRRDVPVLGICLGSQLLAAALGAKVYPNPAGKEIGITRLEVTRDGKTDALFQGLASDLDVLEWHGDAFDVPAGAKLLVTGKRSRNQAFGYGRAYGLLFHLEVSPAAARRMTVIDRAWINQPEPINEAVMLRAVEHQAQKLRMSCQRLCQNFAGLVQPKIAGTV